jgi:hypothetical protein
MKRLSFIAIATVLIAFNVNAMGPEHTGSWWYSEQSGHGFSIEVGEENGAPVAVIYWYTYDSSGNPVFIIGAGTPDQFGVEMTLNAHYGMIYGEFDPTTVEKPDAGVAIFTFQDDKNGNFEYLPSAWTIQNFGHSRIEMPITKLFDASDSNVPPPTGEPVPVPGTWSGRMIYNRGSAAGGACYDADVQISTFLRGANGQWMRINSVSSDAGGLEIINDETLALGWQAVGAFTMYGNEIEFTLIFDSQGRAEGVWTYDNSDCYGEWTFTKD